MINGATGPGKTNSLMGEYSQLLGEAILRQRARAAEQTAHIEADLASKVKSEFISNMSHELRTPLNTIIGFSKLLREHETRPLDNSKIIEYAHLINDSACQLLSVFNDILDISKMQSGRYTLDAEEVNLVELLHTTAASFNQSVEDAGLSLEVRIDRNLPPVRGDSTKLHQIFANLIGNSIKFTGSGGTILIESARMSDGGAAIFVRDSGVGMGEEEIKVALTPFGQVDGTRSRLREGAGLGLPIANALIELHGGRMEITSAKSIGTQVAVLMPSPQMVSVIHGRDLLPTPMSQPKPNVQ